MNYNNLIIERRGEIATVSFNRPKRANALNYDLIYEIEAAALSFRDDIDTKVVVFTGIGKNFCAGADLGDPGAGYSGPLIKRRRRRRVGRKGDPGNIRDGSNYNFSMEWGRRWRRWLPGNGYGF